MRKTVVVEIGNAAPFGCFTNVCNRFKTLDNRNKSKTVIASRSFYACLKSDKQNTDMIEEEFE